MSTENQTDIAIIKLPNVRLSFPHLFQPHTMEAGKEPKFSATFLMDNEKHGALLDKIEKVIARLALDKWKKPTKFRTCLRDGNDKAEMEGYGDGISFISASRKTRPSVVDRQLNPLAEADNTIYAGCYVNASIRLWVQDNQYGKAVNAELRAVQFLKDGESFGAGPIVAENEFDKIEDEGEPSPRSSGRSRSGGGKPSVDDF